MKCCSRPCYSNNPLVNALALGIALRDELFFARARGAGNPVIYVGAKTGRDGIHGASLFASAEFSEESRQKRPNVQVGDPFMEKLLLEACLEVMRTGAVVAIQDMGAAGLDEFILRDGFARLDGHRDRTRARAPARIGHDALRNHAQRIAGAHVAGGEARARIRKSSRFSASGDSTPLKSAASRKMANLRMLENGRIAAEIPAHAIAEEGPVYQRPIAPFHAPESSAPLIKFAPASTDLNENFRKLLASPAIASKRWIIDQYDHMVRTNTRVVPGAGDAAVLRLKESKCGLALATDGNGRWCQLSPRIGAMHAVAEAARNVACSGARPVAATNCLNFGNPEKPEIMSQFSESIDGIAEACRALDVPITGGNVSFYNETLGRGIYPTPVLGVLGILDDADWALGMGFRHEGDAVILLQASASTPKSESIPAEDARREFSSSEYAKAVHGVVAGAPPAIDLTAEKNLIDCLVSLASQRAIESAHDVSDGGVAVTLAEACFASADNLSADVSLETAQLPEFALFRESGARAVVSAKPDSLARVVRIAAQYKMQAQSIGKVTRGEFCIKLNGQPRVLGAMDALRQVWAGALEHALRGN